MRLREAGKINKMFLTQTGNENEEISRSLEADRIHTKGQQNKPSCTIKKAVPRV